MPPLFKISLNRAENSESWSTIKDRFPLRKPSTQSVRFRAAWAIQVELVPERLALGGQAAALVVCQSQGAATSYGPFLQNPVLLDQIARDLGLLTRRPAQGEESIISSNGGIPSVDVS